MKSGESRVLDEALFTYCAREEAEEEREEEEEEEEQGEEEEERGKEEEEQEEEEEAVEEIHAISDRSEKQEGSPPEAQLPWARWRQGEAEYVLERFLCLRALCISRTNASPGSVRAEAQGVRVRVCLPELQRSASDVRLHL
ncbi:hypothetical protein O3P69_015335 [Scylla paramamosain]|uniref:Uncharacterized protein n=1 Tax=Scylla paramamosain TaxID=85552 RepID=A0AAW0T552_SCYPA